LIKLSWGLELFWLWCFSYNLSPKFWRLWVKRLHIILL